MTRDYGSVNPEQATWLEAGTSPTLSVVIPVHNVAPWLEDLLDSVLSQDIGGLEVIAVDDHSSDGSHEILMRRSLLEPRLRVIHPEEGGGGHARNLGIDAASGRYLAFADGDDLVPPGAYRALVASLEQTGSDIAFGDFLKFDTERITKPTKNWLAFKQPHTHETLESLPSLIRNRACWNKVFRRSSWDASGAEFPTVARSNDIQPMTRAYMAASAVDVIMNRVYLYRQRPGDSSMSARAAAAEGYSSYLGQELVCATLLAESGPTSVMREYTALFLDADGWVHFKKFAHQAAQSGAVMPEAARDSLRAIVALLEPERAALTRHERLIPLRLAIDVDPTAGLALARVSEPESETDLPESTELINMWLDALEAVAALPGLEAAVDKAWQVQVAERVLGRGHLDTGERTHATLDRIANMSRTQAAGIDRAPSRAVRRLRALVELPAEQRDMWLAARSVAHSTLTAARRTRDTLTFAGTLADSLADVPLSLRIHRRGASIASTHAVEVVSTDHGYEWSATFDLARVPFDQPGLVVLEVYPDSGLTIDAPLRENDGALVNQLERDRHLWVTPRRLDGGYGAEVRRRATFARRVARTVVRRARSLARR